MHAERRVHSVCENENGAVGGWRSAAFARRALWEPRGLCGGGKSGSGEGGKRTIPVAGRRGSADRPSVGQRRVGGKVGSAISRMVADLQRRVAALEREPLKESAGAEHVPVVSTPAPTSASPAGAAGVESAPALLPLFGWALMGIAGAYLLRALAEAGGIAGAAAVAIGILYATGWLFLAAHRAGEKPVYSTVHGLTSAFILTPMLWEMTVRFRLISATGASIVAGGFAVLGLVMGWRRNVTAVAWVTCASALLIACALFRETHDANLWTATLLAIAAAVEI